jgi:hypothetical protein
MAPFHSANVHFEVDGAEQPVASMLFHAQDEPLPGGHNFVIRLTDETLVALIAPQTDFLSRALAGGVSAHVFGLLHSEVAFVKGYGTESRWILNTVDRLTRADDGLMVEGRCSPVTK